MKRKLPVVEWDYSLYADDGYEHRKVDIVISEESFVGEEVFCLFRRKDWLRIDNNEESDDPVLAVLCNSCGVKGEFPITELQGLNAGQIVPVILNGEYKPNVDIEWIQNKCWNS